MRVPDVGWHPFSDLSFMDIVWTPPPQSIIEPLFLCCRWKKKGWADTKNLRNKTQGGLIPPHRPGRWRATFLSGPHGYFPLTMLDRALCKSLWAQQISVSLQAWTLTSDQQPLTTVGTGCFRSLISHLMSVGTHSPVFHTHSSAATTPAATCMSHTTKSTRTLFKRNRKTSSRSSSGSPSLRWAFLFAATDCSALSIINEVSSQRWSCYTNIADPNEFL